MKFIGTFFLLLLPGSVFSQEYYFRHYNVENGLSHNTVHQALQDEKGFLWFGTKNGLNRFDGYSFKTYKHDPQNPHSIGSNFIESLASSKDFLWVGTSSGLYKMNLKTEAFEPILETNYTPILDIQIDKSGRVWFISNNTLRCFDSMAGKYQSLPNVPKIPMEEITMSPDGNLWISSLNRLFKFQEETQSFQEFNLAPELDNIFPFSISKISALDNTTILLGTVSHGAFLYDVSIKKTVKLLATKDTRIFVRDFLKRNNNLWIATEAGIYLYNLNTKEAINLRKNQLDPYSLSDNAVYCLHQDREGAVWAGTFFGGVNYFSEQFTNFEKYFPQPYKNSISGNAVREIKEDKKGNLWIGTEDAGLNSFNPETKTFKSFALKDLESGLNHSNIHAILPLENELWIGTFQNGLDIVNYSTGKVVKQYKAGAKSGLKSNFIVKLYQSKDSRIFAITSAGIYTYNKGKDAFLPFLGFPENLFYTSFYEDSEGTFWAGTYWNGLYAYNQKTKKRSLYSKNAKQEKWQISSDAINWLTEDSSGKLWIATEDGLSFKLKGSTSFQRVDVHGRFPSTIFYTITEIAKKNYWLSTANGLVWLSKDLNEIQVFGTENGLLSNQFNYNSVFQAKSGKLYYGGVKGLISFDPYELLNKREKVQNTIALTNLEINNTPVETNTKGSPLRYALSYTHKISLDPSQSSINIEFSALDYEAPKLTTYAYKMEGLNREWQNLGNVNKVFFTKLPAGTYTLFLKAKVGNKPWSEEVKVLEIEVLPFFLVSKWAYFIYLVLLAFLLYWLFRRYHLLQEQKNAKLVETLNNQREKEVYQSKIEFFTNLSHEILTPLTLIKNPLDRIMKNPPVEPDVQSSLYVMQKNTSRLLDLVKQLLDFRKTETHRLTLTYVETDLNLLLLDVLSRFKDAIVNRDIDLKHNLEGESILAFVDQEALKKIFSNLISNALKYCESKIRIRLQQEGDCFQLRVKSDGDLIPSHLKDKIFEPFFQQAKENDNGAGIGLSLAKSLSQLHNGSLELDSSISTMNAFILKIPLHQEKEFIFRPKPYTGEKNVGYHEDSTKAENGQKPAVLLVEDNLDLLDFIAQDLREEYLVFKTSSAEEALKVLKEESIQLVISDIMMSGMNGIELCKTIKLDLEYSHIPVILLTSKSALSSKMEGLEAGADAYVEKPFSVDFLEVQIHNLLNNRKKIVEHFSTSPLAHIRSIAHTKTDETFIEKLDKVILENLADTTLSVDTLSEIMNMSRSTLYRKITELTEQSPNNLINLARLKKAAELLKSSEYRINEVSFMVGYNSVSSFGRNFQKQFKMTPSEYINSLNK